MKNILKRTLSALVSSAMILSLFSSCNMAGDGSTGKLSEYFTGEMLPVTATVTEGMGNGEMVQNAVNSVGMSGMYASNHLHGNSGDGMYITQNNATDVNFTFETQATEPIGRVFIWNYCEKGNTSAGLKKVTASYSHDGKDYTILGEYEIAEGDPSGEESYSAVIDFKGVAAKFIRITPAEENGNYGDRMGRYGIAEIRVYRFKTHPEKRGAVISAVYLESEDSDKITKGENSVNNLGMSGTLSVKDTHSNDPGHMTVMDISKGKCSIVYDLDGTYPIQSLYIWNYNDPDNLDKGVKNVIIYYSPDGNTFIPLRDENRDTVKTLTKASGEDNIAPTDVIDMEGIHACRIKIEVQVKDGTYGNSGEAGISEVRFTVDRGWAAEPARDWTGLFSRQEGWLAADGIYTCNLNGYDIQGSTDEDTKTLFIFSDTAVGTVDYRNMSVDRSGFFNHTFAYLDGAEPDPKKLKFVLEHPSGGNIFRDAVWLTDLVRLDENSVRIGGFKFNSNWGADRMDMGTVAISKTTGYLDLKKISKVEGVAMKYNKGNAEVMMYSGVLNESRETGNPKGDGYIYLYGFRNHDGFKKNLVVARTLPENFDNIKGWEYYNGEEWLPGIENADTKSAYISKENISSELSVTRITSGMYKGKYLLVYTANTMSSQVKFAVSDNPEGLFEDAQFLYFCPEVDEYKAMGDDGIYTYNCKAHPSLSAKGELLISYNVNSTTNYNENTYRYYPQFIKMYEIK